MQGTDSVVPRGRGLGVSKMGEGNQKAQIPGYKINKSWDLMRAIVSYLILYI